MRSELGNGNPYRDSASELDWVSLGRALGRKKWRIITPTIVVALIAAVAVNFLSPRYKSEARILIEARENAFLRPEAEKAGDGGAGPDSDLVASQVQILTSRDLARQVIRDLKLTENPEFDPVQRGVSFTSILMSLVGLGKDPLKASPEERALAAYYQRLTVTPVEKSRVITVEFQSSNPELSARVANAIADTYLVMQQAAKREQTRGASRWLSGEIEKLREKVAEAESKVEEFRARTGLFVGNGTTSLGSQQLSEMTAQLSAARAEKATLDAKAAAIRDMIKSGQPVDSADFTNSELLRRLVEQRITLRAQLAEQSSTLLELHPRIQELRAQINALDTQIRGELLKVARSIENDARIAGGRVETTAAAIEKLKKQIAASGGEDVQLRALEREAKAQRDLLESYLAKYREATARESIDVAPPDSRIISRAAPANEPSFPKKGPIVLIAALGTLFFAASMVMAVEILGGGSGDRVAPPAKKERWRAASLLDLVRRKKNTESAHHQAAADGGAIPVTSASPMSVDDLAVALRRSGESGRSIAVIGMERNIGTTFTALALSRALAREGARVVLVDLALAAPNLAALSVNPDAPGLAELVRGEASFGDIVTRERFSRVHLVAAGRTASMAILASPRLAMALAALTRTYDHIVIDGGEATDTAIAGLARLARRAALVRRDSVDAASLQARILAAGFADVAVLAGRQNGLGASPRAA
jgi:succinoglycan biosynthesis transport protein ExoP